MRFNHREVIRALGAVSDREVVVVPLTGQLVDETPIRGEDVIVVIVPRGRTGPSLEAGLSPDLEDDDAEVISVLDDQG